MAKGVQEAFEDAVFTYLESTWTRTALAAFSQGVTIADPGHGRDEICPVVRVGSPFDPDDPTDTAPFDPDELRDSRDGASVQDGVGFVAHEIRRSGMPVTVSPGVRPLNLQRYEIDTLIATPSGRGPGLKTSYAGALAMILRYVYLNPGEGGINYIENREPPPEATVPEGDDETWRYDRMSTIVDCYYFADTA